ncbi:MAG TPA: FAD-dependent oxidoreductase [Terriglobales bacterium]|nr:FAD-dependent oxidoreductase [Terriglobales bacterium]
MRARPDAVVLGAGVTGLAIGAASGCPLFEATLTPGGICSSYYLRSDRTIKSGVERLLTPPGDDEAYRFEVGGGHWIFGADPMISNLVANLAPARSYSRRSAVFFPDWQMLVPYPLQNNLAYLPKDVRRRALSELLHTSRGCALTMAASLQQSFGRTLTDLFFGPFHESYTAGLWTRIAPQDQYKTPLDLQLILRGSTEHSPTVGYNKTFLYPQDGLSFLSSQMAERCDIRYSHRVVHIDVAEKQVVFAGGKTFGYESIMSTLPLNEMLALADLTIDQEADPFCSVLVLNIGAMKGSKLPNEHWIYVPKTTSGFHRIGFYSNVDSSFLPASYRTNADRVSMYVERSFLGGTKPSDSDLADYTQAVIRELQGWEFIERVDVVDPTWIRVAYTWSWSGSHWRSEALKRFQENSIIMAGRYGRWSFQGIAASIREGLSVGACHRLSKHKDFTRR